jgi:hypothetical protein
VLPKKHHAVHHKPPFDKYQKKKSFFFFIDNFRYYCITTGHLNSLLDGIGFWRRFEAVVTFVFGMKPREDDKRWTQQLYGISKTQ